MDVPVTVTRRDGATLSDDEFGEHVELAAACLAVSNPEDPPPDLARHLAARKAIPERIRRIAIEARDTDGLLVGTSSFSIDPDHDDNPDLLGVPLSVHPDHRRRGVGSALLAEAVRFAEQDGRKRLRFWTQDRSPAGAAMATSLGATIRIEEHVNHLPVEAIDRAELERWVADGPRRAPDYELIAIDHECPEEHVQGLVDMILVLNTAPRDDLDENDFTLTVEQLREWERIDAAAGNEVWTLLARNTVTGEYAGMHDVSWHPTKPATVEIGITAVDPTHRGHALGKWLKAAMTLRILDERPGLVDIRTENADSNAAMLGINEAMGYRHYISTAGWELSTAEAAAWLAARGLA